MNKLATNISDSYAHTCVCMYVCDRKSAKYL